MPGALPRLQILGAALLFSSGGAAIKAAAFTSWQVAGLRSLVAAVAVFLFLPQARRLGATPRDRLRTGLVALAYAATLVLFVLANKLTTSANTIFLQSTAPLYVLLLGPILLGERVRQRDLLFIAAVGLGMAVLMLGEQRQFTTAPDPGAATCWRWPAASPTACSSWGCAGPARRAARPCRRWGWGTCSPSPSPSPWPCPSARTPCRTG